MLTPRGIALLLAAVLLWGVGRLIAVDELHVVAVTSGVLVLFTVLALRLTTATIAVQRELSTEVLGHQAHGEVALVLRNAGRVPAPPLLVTDDVHWTLAERPRAVVTGLRAGHSHTFSYGVVGSQRGAHPVGPVSVRMRDPFGLAQVTRRYTRTDRMIVLPAVERLTSGPSGGSNMGSGSGEARRTRDAGDEFHTMREYVQGDDLRKVHWASSARRGTLLVRQNQMPWHPEAAVVVETMAGAHSGSGPDSTFEKALSIAASLVCRLDEQGYRVQMALTAEGRALRFERRDLLLERLAVAAPGKAATSGAALSHALRRVPSEGLAIVVCATSPSGRAPGNVSPEVRALLGSNKSRGGIAVLVHDSATGAARADAARTPLLGGGWQVATCGVTEPFAPAWEERARPRALVTGGRR